MAGTLTEAQKIDVAQILGVKLQDVTDQMTFLGELFTTQVATDVVAELSRWSTYGAKFTRVEPMTTNKGADYDPGRIKDDIRRNIAVLFQNDEWISGAGSGSAQARLYRG